MSAVVYAWNTMAGVATLVEAAARYSPVRLTQGRMLPSRRASSIQVTKAQELLAQRGVLALAARRLEPEAVRAWHASAIATQATIYSLDGYYEESAKIESGREAHLWRGVARRLYEGEGARDEGVWGAFEDLRRYAEAERRVHAFDPIDIREFGSILTLKCADVRIARSLVWCHDSRSVDVRERRFWCAYDECWELIEDLEDLDEDGRDWNFNFWLYPFMVGRSADEGVSAVGALLHRKVAALDEISTSLPGAVRTACRDALLRTFERAHWARLAYGRVSAAVRSGAVERFDMRPQDRAIAQRDVGTAAHIAGTLR